MIIIGEVTLQLGQLQRGNLKHWINWLIFLPFVHTFNKRLNCNTYFLLTYNLLQNVSASLSHHQVYTHLQNLLHCHLSVSHVNVLQFLIWSKYLNFDKITDSTALHPVNSGIFMRQHFCVIFFFSHILLKCTRISAFQCNNFISALSNGPTSTWIFHPFTWGRKQMQFWKYSIPSEY
jgi:hypothetical protein